MPLSPRWQPDPAGDERIAARLAALPPAALDPAFVTRKLASIRFFGTNMLTACGGLSAAVMAGNDVVDDIGLEALAG